MEINNFRNHSLSYKITSFNPSTGQISIICDEYPMQLMVDLPINDGKYLEGDELDNYIRGFIPVWLIDRQKQIAKGITNENYINTLIQLQPKEESDDFDEELFIKSQYDKFINSMITTLRSTDWTQLPDVELSEEDVLKFREYRKQINALRKTIKNAGPENFVIDNTNELLRKIIKPEIPD